jgi:heme exporter protein C
VLIIAAIFSIQFLRKRERRYDTMARVAMEVTLVFVLLTMATGILWTRAEWGVWWVWEPRLTTYFILTLGVVAYFVLRNAVEDEERRGVYAAVVAILVAIDAPISFAITRIYRSYHPVVFGGGADSGLEPDMLITFIFAQLGMLMIGYVVYQMRMREERVKDRLEAVKTALEG